MEKNFKRAASLLLALVCLFICQQVAAQSKPLWAQKGEKSLNKKRTNEGYQFKVFNTYGMDVDKLHKESLQPLLDHVAERYGVEAGNLSLDSVRTGLDSTLTYSISFAEGGTPSVVYARKVDDYCAYEDYADNTYQFEYYQLYAITEAGQGMGIFDDFEVTRSYNATALGLSVIPGFGQIYKGQKAKGYAILGAEAVLVADAIIFAAKKHHCDNKMTEQPEVRDSWKSKSNGWRNLRNISLGLAGGLYLYNLIDAAVSKGARQVIVRKPSQYAVSMAPLVTPDGGGLSFALNF